MKRQTVTLISEEASLHLHGNVIRLRKFGILYLYQSLPTVAYRTNVCLLVITASTAIFSK